MSGSVNAGSIVYEVDMDTSRLIAARREVDAALNGLSGSMGRLDASVTRTERSVASMERTMSGLSGVAKGVIAALSIQQVAQYGNEWVTVNNKLANSVRASEQLVDVTQRVFDISQDTRSSLEATATLYGRLERATRSAGTSTADLITLTSTINKGLVVSGATAEEASSTMTQLSQALASGVLRGEEFNSISENGSRLAVALADSLGVTIGQLRGMAAQGKLTTEVVVNGLLKQSDVIAKEFANTVRTMGQALTIATNNITKFVGESSSVQSAINVFNKGVISLSENLELIGSAVAILGAVMGSRFVGMLAAATGAKIKLAFAARETALSDNQAAQAAANLAAAELRVTLAAKQRAIEEIRLAEMMRASAFNAANAAAAEAALSAARVNAATATDNYNRALAANTAAQAAANTAARNASLGIGLFRGALALVGGPVGFATLAAAAVLYFSNAAKEARKESNDLADSVNSLVEKFKAMSDTELASSIAKLSKNIPELNDALDDSQKAFSEASNRVAELEKEIRNWGEGTKRGRQAAEALSGAQDDLAIAADNLAQAHRRLDQTNSAINIGRSTLNGTIKQGIDLLRRDGDQAGVAAGMMNHLGNAIDFASRAKDKFNSTSLQIPRSDKADAYNKDLEDENKLLAITDKRLRAVTKARMEARDKGGNQNQVNSAEQLAGEQYDLQAAEAARNKETKAGIAEDKKAETQAKRNADVLEEYRQKADLTADSISGLSREHTILAARQKLTNPNPQQIAQVEKDAAAAWDKAAALKAQATVPELKENADYAAQKTQLEMLKGAKDSQGNLLISQQQYNQQSELLEQDHQVSLAKIRADTAAGITPLQNAQGAIDPVQALANENARKLALIQQFETEKGAITANGLALMNAQNTEYEQARIDAAWKIWENQNQTNQLLGGAIDSLQGGATNAITGLIDGTQSLQESLANIGSTILSSVVGGLVEMGLQYVKSMIMGQVAATASLAATTAQATAAAAAWAPAAMSASIATYGTAATVGSTAYAGALAMAQGMAVAGARKNGGPVSAGSMYQVGEGGMPEIYQASTGKQYMIPGDNGSVISNKDIGGTSGTGTSVQQNVHFNIQTTGGIDDATMQKMATMMKNVSLNTIKDQSTRPKGMIQPRK